MIKYINSDHSNRRHYGKEMKFQVFEIALALLKVVCFIL